MTEKVRIHPKVRDGRPCVRGTHFLVSQLMAELSEGSTLTEICDDFDLSLEAATDALQWAAMEMDGVPTHPLPATVDTAIRNDECSDIVSWIRGTSSIWTASIRNILGDLADQIADAQHRVFHTRLTDLRKDSWDQRWIYMDRVDTKTLEIALEGSFHKDYAYTVRLDGCLLRKDYDFTPILSNEHIVGFKLTSKNAYPFGMKGLDFNGFRSHTRGAKWNSVMVWEEIG